MKNPFIPIIEDEPLEHLNFANAYAVEARILAFEYLNASIGAYRNGFFRVAVQNAIESVERALKSVCYADDKGWVISGTYRQEWNDLKRSHDMSALRKLQEMCHMNFIMEYDLQALEDAVPNRQAHPKSLYNAVRFSEQIISLDSARAAVEVAYYLCYLVERTVARSRGDEFLIPIFQG